MVGLKARDDVLVEFEIEAALLADALSQHLFVHFEVHHEDGAFDLTMQKAEIWMREGVPFSEL